MRKSKSTIVGYAIIGAIWLGLILVILAVYRHESRAWEAYKESQVAAEQVVEDPINEYDPRLGWKHIPGKFTEDVFPGGIGVQINNQGLRAEEDYSHEKPPGVYRIIVVGDSFTFGLVKYEETWPFQLQSIAEGLQVINMGACAYGVDQMYLWYEQDGLPFETDLVILAVIVKDFERAYQYKWMSGHGRPRFVLEGDQLELTNVPVPRRVNPGELNLHPRDYWSFLQMRYFSPRDRKPQGRLHLRIIEEFRNTVEARGSKFMLLLLPRYYDLDRDVFAGAREFAAAKDIACYDISEYFKRTLSSSRIERATAYLPDRHYNAYGNQLVAEGVLAYLTENHDLGPSMVSAEAD